MRANDDTRESNVALQEPAGTSPLIPASLSAATEFLSTNTYRAGIIGAGFMGRVHARAIRVGGGTLVGVVASSPERTAAASREFGAVDQHHTAQSLIDSPDVDVIHICTPNSSHYDYALAALAAGKHVVCEKPLATSVEAAKELVDTAAERGLIATVPFVYRFHPMVREARERIRSGAVGPVHLVHGSYLQDWLLRPSDTNWRVNPADGGPSRAFADIGSHWCDLAEFVTGDRITAVSARASTVNRQRGEFGLSTESVNTEDIMTLQFETEAGSVGTSVISQVSAGRKNRLLLEISTAESTLTFDQEQPEQLWLGGRDESRLLVRDPDTLSPAARKYARVPAGHAQGYQDCFDHFVADTAAAMSGQSVDGLPTFADGLRASRVADAVLTSARTRQWIEVAP